MARINVEVSIYKERGFQELMVHFGSRRLAKGALLDLFELAQDYWFPDRKPIPKEVFEAWDLPPILYAKDWGLCILKSDGIYVRGSEKQFTWLFQRRAAGQASAAAKKADKKEENEEPEPDSTTVEIPSTGVQHTSTARNLSSLYSSLSSLSSNLPTPDSLLSSDCARKKQKTLGALTFEAYAGAFRARYDGVDPIRNAKVNSQFKKLGDWLGEEAPLVAAFYLTHTDFVYVKSNHCVDLLVRDAQKLRTEWLRGKTTTSISARQQERDGHSMTVAENYLRNKHQNKERQV